MTALDESVPLSPSAPRTFAGFLLTQNWNSAIQLTLRSNSYYHNPTTTTPTSANEEEEEEKKEDDDEEESEEQTALKKNNNKNNKNNKNNNFFNNLSSLASRIRRYGVNASATRRAVHGLSAAYLLYLLLHPSRTVSASVTYHRDKFMKPKAAGFNFDDAVVVDNVDNVESPVLLNRLRRWLQSIFFSTNGFSDADYAVFNAQNSRNNSPLDGKEEVVYLYESREGMQLLLKKPLSAGATAAHAVMGCLLFIASLFQLESVFFMRRPSTLKRREKHPQTAATETAAQKKKNNKEETFHTAETARNGHCVVGVVSCVLMIGMTTAGYNLRDHSLFSALGPNSRYRTATIDFGRALFYFAMPWGLFTVALLFTAQTKKTIPHAIVGALISKACLAVALARSLGAGMQRLLGVHVRLPPPPPHQRLSDSSTSHEMAVDASKLVESEVVHIVQAVPGELERVYYVSIATAAVVVGLWATCDIVAMLRSAHATFVEQEERKKKERR